MHGWNPQRLRGSWIVFSPLEDFCSIFEVIWIIVHVARALAEATNVASQKRKWCRDERTVLFKPSTFAKNEHVFKFRELRFATAKATVFTARQRICYVMGEIIELSPPTILAPSMQIVLARKR